jgi:hypothetical protein
VAATTANRGRLERSEIAERGGREEAIWPDFAGSRSRTKTCEKKKKEVQHTLAKARVLVYTDFQELSGLFAFNVRAIGTRRNAIGFQK